MTREQYEAVDKQKAMTREEAREILEIILEEYRDAKVFAPRLPALEMAIEALKQPEIIRCKDCDYFVEGNYADGCKKYPLFCFRPHTFCSNARRREDGKEKGNDNKTTND